MNTNELDAALAALPETHEAATWFPMMKPAEILDLATDIKRAGQRESIKCLGGHILDGRNRWVACRIAGVAPLFEDVDTADIGDPFRYVVSLNLHRRHLDESQRAMLGARLREHFSQQAKKRQKEHGGTAPGKAAESLPANLREVSREASEDAAREVNVSPRSIDTAVAVLKKGTPALVQAVDRGEIAVSAAAEVARLPVMIQEQAVAAGPETVTSTAKAQREGRKTLGKPERKRAAEEALGAILHAESEASLARAWATASRLALEGVLDEDDAERASQLREQRGHELAKLPKPAPPDARQEPLLVPSVPVFDPMAQFAAMRWTSKGVALVDKFIADLAAHVAARPKQYVTDETAREGWESAVSRMLEVLINELPDDAKPSPRLSVIHGGK